MTDYRGLMLEDTRQGASDAALAQLEASLGAPLPADYREFLTTCNGAYLEYDVAVTLASGERELMSFSLYGLDLDGEWESNPYELERARQRPGYPAHGLLPIGRDGGASLLLLDLRVGRQQVAAMVAAYIGAAYWFTASTSFANPAAVFGRMFSDSFAGIAPASAPGFVLAELVGAALAVAVHQLLSAPAKARHV